MGNGKVLARAMRAVRARVISQLPPPVIGAFSRGFHNARRVAGGMFTLRSPYNLKIILKNKKQ